MKYLKFILPMLLSVLLIGCFENEDGEALQPDTQKTLPVETCSPEPYAGSFDSAYIDYSTYTKGKSIYRLVPNTCQTYKYPLRSYDSRVDTLMAARDSVDHSKLRIQRTIEGYNVTEFGQHVSGVSVYGEVQYDSAKGGLLGILDYDYYTIISAYITGNSKIVRLDWKDHTDTTEAVGWIFPLQ